jgi:hypothetical protein
MSREPQANPDALDRLGTALARLGAVLLAIGLVGLALDGCHPRLPPVSGCTPRVYDCRDGRPVVCSASQRWQNIGDLPCAAVGGVCVVRDGGSLALCERARDASADAPEVTP